MRNGMSLKQFGIVCLLFIALAATLVLVVIEEWYVAAILAVISFLLLALTNIISQRQVARYLKRARTELKKSGSSSKGR